MLTLAHFPSDPLRPGQWASIADAFGEFEIVEVRDAAELASAVVGRRSVAIVPREGVPLSRFSHPIDDNTLYCVGPEIERFHPPDACLRVTIESKRELWPDQAMLIVIAHRYAQVQ